MAITKYKNCIVSTNRKRKNTSSSQTRGASKASFYFMGFEISTPLVVDIVDLLPLSLQTKNTETKT